MAGYVLVHIGTGTYYAGTMQNGERSYARYPSWAIVFSTVDQALSNAVDVERVEPFDSGKVMRKRNPENPNEFLDPL